MRKIWLSGMILMFSHLCWAIYGPSLARTDVAVAARACRDGHFERGPEIVKAMQDGKPDEILLVLSDALKEWNATSVASEDFNALYAARSFCIHELVPDQLEPASGPGTGTQTSRQPPSSVSRFKELGIEYFYYSPDAVWTLEKDPVDLNYLATNFLNSEWGRRAFLMMTLMGWSQGACREGPDQFREVIKHGETFLRQYPDSEVSDSVRLELANAYATWWNVSQREPDEFTAPEQYSVGAHEAKQRAVGLYEEYLSAHPAKGDDVRKRLTALRNNPKGSETYDYYCADYED